MYFESISLKIKGRNETYLGDILSIGGNEPTRYYYLYLFIYSKRSLGYFTLKIDRSICSDLRNFSKTFTHRPIIR